MSIIHYTAVDFTRRVISEPVHIVQGDKTLPQIEVELLADGQPYTIPSGASVAIRYGKPDGNAIVNNAASTSGNTATFTVTEQMSALPGEMSPQVMVTVSGGVAATGSFPLIIDKNSVEGAKDSESELSVFDKAINAVATVDASVAAAKASQDAAAKSATSAASSASSASSSKTAAAASEKNAKASELAASESKADAAISVTNAAASATAAKASEDNASVSATTAADSAKASANSATAAKASEDAAAKTLTDIGTAKEEAVSAIGDAKTEALTAVATDKDAAAKSATDAADSATLARSYARGDTATRDGEDTDNAKYYMEQAQKAALGNLDDKMSDTSENAVKNKVIKAYVDGHTPTLNEATDTASGLMSAADKAKLDGIEAGATAQKVAIATTDTVGTVKPDGETILVDKDGKVSVPTATETAFGLVKPDGETITIKDGVLSGQSKVAIATTDTVGTVKPDGPTITIDTDGTIHGTPQNDLGLSIVDGKLCVTYEKEAS